MTHASFPASLLLPLALLLSLCGSAMAADPMGSDILGQDEDQVSFLLTLSGAANTLNFSNVNAILSVRQPATFDLNSYLIVVVGFPRSNVRNAFFWNSEDGHMEAFGNSITSKTNSFGLSQNHFFYLSPALFASKGPLTHRDKERIQETERVAEPGKVFATSGTLTLMFSGSSVTGTVHMTGIDNIGHEQVQYHATFSGVRTTLPPPPQ